MVLGMRADENSDIVDLNRFQSTVGAIYDAALRPELWPVALQRATDLIDGSAGLLFTPRTLDGPRALVIPDNISPEVMQQYTSHYHRLDVWTQAGAARGLFVTGNVVCDEDLVPRKQLMESQYFREFLQPAGISRICVSVVFGEEDAEVPATVISIYRGLNATAFGCSERDTLRLLVPHISRSLGCMYRLRLAESRVASSMEALDRINRGIILFDAVGRVLHVNRWAASILEASDGISLIPEGATASRLFVSDVRKRQLLESLIASALSVSPLGTGHFSKGLLVTRRAGRQPLFLSVSSLSGDSPYRVGENQPQAIGFLADLEMPHRLDENLFADSFGLTRSELRLVANLCAGKTIAEIARQLGLSPQTLRDQLKSIFVKTGTNRQANLVRLALSLSK